MRTRVIVPHRGLDAAKTRLAGVLDPAARAALAEHLLRHVLEAVAGAGAEAVVISPDPDLATLVGKAAARLSVQRGMGLNAGLEQARREALAEGVVRLGVLHGDLPSLTPDDVEALLAQAAGPDATVVIAPDAAGSGTNGLALSPPGIIGFHFGRGSHAAHVAAARAAGATVHVLRRAGIAFDLDTPEDLAAWLRGSDAA